MFHQSAIIASMLDTATFPLRRNYGPKMSMLDLVHSLVQHNRKAVGISGCMPILERGILSTVLYFQINWFLFNFYFILQFRL